MEGPSLVIACEEFKPFLKKRIDRAYGSAKLPFKELKGAQFKKVQSWGKHLLITIGDHVYRVHFLMFGSYRIDDPRENREPKLELVIGKDKLYFYSCAIRELEQKPEKIYDWSNDLMSKDWDPKKAAEKLKRKPQAMVCDVLMDQEIFSGLGNIIKNEVLWRLKMDPVTRVEELSPARIRALVKEAHTYSWEFYHWKKEGVLKRNWKVFRKKVCPRCDLPVIKQPTGKLERLSHFCTNCQLRK